MRIVACAYMPLGWEGRILSDLAQSFLIWFYIVYFHGWWGQTLGKMPSASASPALRAWSQSV